MAKWVRWISLGTKSFAGKLPSECEMTSPSVESIMPPRKWCFLPSRRPSRTSSKLQQASSSLRATRYRDLGPSMTTFWRACIDSECLELIAVTRCLFELKGFRGDFHPLTYRFEDFGVFSTEKVRHGRWSFCILLHLPFVRRVPHSVLYDILNRGAHLGLAD